MNTVYSWQKNLFSFHGAVRICTRESNTNSNHRIGIIEFTKHFKNNLNSLWRKFGQRSNMVQKKYVTDPSEFYKIYLDIEFQFLNDVIQLVIVIGPSGVQFRE